MQTNDRTLHYIDQTSEKSHHMVFNASMLEILNKIYPNNKLVYYGVLSNQIATKSILNPDLKNKIDYQAIQYPKSPNNTFFKIIIFIFKELVRILNFITILIKSNKEDYIFLSITTFSSFLSFKILKLFFKVNTFAVIHGDIDFLYSKNKSSIEKLNAFVHKIIFRIKQKSFKFIFINKISKKIIVKDKYLSDYQIIEINHSYSIHENFFLNKEHNFNTIKIAHIGSMEAERKNSHLIYDLATKFAKDYSNIPVEFQTIGLITPLVLPFKNDLVIEKTGNTKPNQPAYLDRETYEKYCADLQFTLFFYSTNQYVFRTSGAIIDTIAMKIPVIGLKHPFFDYVIDKVGPIGYFFETYDELKTNLHNKLSDTKTLTNDYTLFIKNLDTAKKLFSINNIANDLKVQINN